jgi:hypothetical protein
MRLGRYGRILGRQDESNPRERGKPHPYKGDVGGYAIVGGSDATGKAGAEPPHSKGGG